jgi:flavodoxin
MARILIVYHSRSGYTRRVARALAGRLAADLDGIEVVQPLGGVLGYAMCAIEAVTGLAPALRPGSKDPADYDLVLIGTPVWFWSLSSPVRSWLERHTLRGRKFAFFCTMSGSGASGVFATMKQLAGGEPLATLALTDAEIDAGARARLDAFVNAMRTGPRPRSRGPGSKAASAASRAAA